MLILFTCPKCERENEQEIDLDECTDYLSDDEVCEILCECEECGRYVRIDVHLEIRENK